MSLAIQLRLLDVSQSSTIPCKDDAVPSARHLEKILDDLFHPSSRIRCESSRECLFKMMAAVSIRDHDDNQCQKQRRKEFLQQITRFLQIKDRYLALASLLLKSRAFFETYHDDTDTDEQQTHIRRDINNNSSNNINNIARQTIVSLPRTQYKKPYIPTLTTSVASTMEQQDANADANINADPDEVNAFSISLSHQWPFAGLARISHHNNNNNKCSFTQKDNEPTLLVGFDIVTFDDNINPRLYNSVDEFIHVFRESFAPNEWQTILSHQEENERAMLREFYLQWSVKEAYTKALGVGLGFDFQSFYVEWDDRDDDDDDDDDDISSSTNDATKTTSLWEVLQSSCRVNEPTDRTIRNTQQTFVEMSGVIAKTAITNPSQKERWKFLFVPLHQTANEKELSSSTGQDTMIGAGCACIGPFPADNEKDYTEINKVEWEIEWTDLDSMISYVKRRR